MALRDDKTTIEREIRHKLTSIERYIGTEAYSSRKRSVAEIKKAIDKMPTMTMVEVQALFDTITQLDRSIESGGMFG